MGLLFACCFLLLSVTQASNQFHLSLVRGTGSSIEYAIDWVTPSSSSSSSSKVSNIIYGYKSNDLSYQAEGTFVGQVEEESGKYVSCWTTRLSQLQAGKEVFYALAITQEDGALSNRTNTNSFFVKSSKDDMKWAVFGDMGASILGGPSAVSIQALQNALFNDQAYDGILNLGDIGYELTQENGKDYMEKFAPILSRVPMQITTGNHEYKAAMAPFYTLRNFRRRFAGQLYGLGKPSGSNSNEFFSFDAGLIHFIMINTEFYSNEDYYIETLTGEWIENEKARQKDRLVQLKWLEKDLEQIDRTKTPYVILMGHRTPFRTPKGLDTKDNLFGQDIVPLMDKYQIDLYLCGHTHLYLVLKESRWNGYRLPPIIVSGSSGNQEIVDAIFDLKLGHFEVEEYAEKYGFGFLSATQNALEWQWGHVASSSGLNPLPQDWKKESSLQFPRRF
jgi:hypothetical protein